MRGLDVNEQRDFDRYLRRTFEVHADPLLRLAVVWRGRPIDDESRVEGLGLMLGSADAIFELVEAADFPVVDVPRYLRLMETLARHLLLHAVEHEVAARN